MPVEGYPTRNSVLPGDELGVCCSGRGPMTVEVARLGAEREVVWRADGIAVDEQPVPEDAAANGCGWAETLSIPIGRDWRSGCYELAFRPDDGSDVGRSCVAVRAPVGERAPLLLVLSTTTYAAYNNWGGPNLYEGGTEVSFDRPWIRGFVARPDEPHGRHAIVGDPPDPDNDRLFEYLARHGLSQRAVESGFATWEHPFIRWAERNGIRFDVAQSTDLQFAPDCLDGYAGYVSVGHDEYWSWEMRDVVEAFIGAGGNAAFFSGNACFWQIRLSEGGRHLLSHKYGGPWFDPVIGTPDERRMTGMWSDPLIGRPENHLTGVSFSRGGYVRFGHAAPRGSGGYTVWQPKHWALDGTGLRYGDVVGAEPVVVGYEADGCDLTFRDGRPVATGADGTPSSFEVVATSPAHLWSSGPDGVELPIREGHDPTLPADLQYVAMRLFGDWEPEHTERITNGHAVMGSYRADGGGEVFTTGCTDWAYGLGDRPDPTVARVTANVLDRLSRLSG